SIGNHLYSSPIRKHHLIPPLHSRPRILLNPNRLIRLRIILHRHRSHQLDLKRTVKLLLSTSLLLIHDVSSLLNSTSWCCCDERRSRRRCESWHDGLRGQRSGHNCDWCSGGCVDYQVVVTALASGSTVVSMMMMVMTMMATGAITPGSMLTSMVDTDGSIGGVEPVDETVWGWWLVGVELPRWIAGAEDVVSELNVVENCFADYVALFVGGCGLSHCVVMLVGEKMEEWRMVGMMEEQHERVRLHAFGH
ncbi:hypothetical protein BZA77DRAFT_376389, partial [Pyronema omphalodes]